MSEEKRQWSLATSVDPHNFKGGIRLVEKSEQLKIADSDGFCGLQHPDFTWTF